MRFNLGDGSWSSSESKVLLRFLSPISLGFPSLLRDITQRSDAVVVTPLKPGLFLFPMFIRWLMYPALFPLFFLPSDVQFCTFLPDIALLDLYLAGLRPFLLLLLFPFLLLFPSVAAPLLRYSCCSALTRLKCRLYSDDNSGNVQNCSFRHFCSKHHFLLFWVISARTVILGLKYPGFNTVLTIFPPRDEVKRC